MREVCAARMSENDAFACAIAAFLSFIQQLNQLLICIGQQKMIGNLERREQPERFIGREHRAMGRDIRFHRGAAQTSAVNDERSRFREIHAKKFMRMNLIFRCNRPKEC